MRQWWVFFVDVHTSAKSLSTSYVYRQGKAFLILDECSMADKGPPFRKSKTIIKIQGEKGTGASEEPYGGMNVILFGDFHQFPPVQRAHRALYVSAHPKDGKEDVLGRQLFLQFDNVVILKQQNRMRDSVWQDILN